MELINLKQGFLRITGKAINERLGLHLDNMPGDWIEKYLTGITSVAYKSSTDYPEPHPAGWHQGAARTFGTRLNALCATGQYSGGVITRIPRCHAFATHLLNHGADLRVVQMLPGAVTSNTQIYTPCCSSTVWELHGKYHPRG